MILSTSILFGEYLRLEWEETSLADNKERDRLEKLLLETVKKEGNSLLWLIVLGLSDETIPVSASLEFWRTFASSWVHLVRSDPEAEKLRDSFSVRPDKEEISIFRDRMPPMIGAENIGDDFLDALFESLNQTFQTAVRSFKGPIEQWFESISPKPTHVDRIHFHIVENRSDVQRPFAFLATYTTRIDATGQIRHLPLKAALTEFSDDSRKLLELLSTVKTVAHGNALLAAFEKSGELFNPVALTPGEAFEFLVDVPRFEAAGILCRIPRWWKGTRKITVSLAVGDSRPSAVGNSALLGFDARLHLDGEIIDEDEARQILEQSDGLAQIKGKWVAVDVESLARTLDLFTQARRIAENEEVSFSDAMRLLMGFQTADGPSLAEFGVSTGTWLASVFEKMASPSLVRQTVPSAKLKARLRPYQQHGLNWLSFLHTLGFGACLADDMGLGKTVQVLAFLQKVRTSGRCSLIVCPASLLDNWQREIEKFTPDLTTIVIHPQACQDVPIDELRALVPNRDIAITTYGMISKVPWVRDVAWFHVICDEAQAIKNPGTQQTKSVKALRSDRRIVMTGTPVENRLTDLWSLFDFVNPGLLGTLSEFKTFISGLDDDPRGYGRLRRIVHPFILRRSKSDKTIIGDLPEKVEMKTYCPLSKTQIVLYKNLVSRLGRELKLAEGIKRKGVVLGYLMKCKQLCNHPDHYNGTGPFDHDKSGKFERLGQLCETIRDKREQLLLFTQFAEIIKPLGAYLESVFGYEGVTLSGASSIKQRKAAIDRFQDPGVYTPFFILSLKAGGVGLNLTNASHVIHFDRWWNPAVENQATDRAYRIGQKKNVMVHKFICKGTIEEKIDAMMEDKKMLAEQIIPSASENWITQMSDQQLTRLFALTLQNFDD